MAKPPMADRRAPTDEPAPIRPAKARAPQPDPKAAPAKASEKPLAAKADRPAPAKPEKTPTKADGRGGYREPHGRDSRGHGGHSGSMRHLGEHGRDASVAGAEHHGYKHSSTDR